ncbi:hypothetical protein [[Clostridium] dakarense]|uniref:hypothetical protein n=1 Tax=Faecalimicrobium dakarense TaxID=1301100 RepID=UPI0004B55C64|nr:hypothetical protein [[Clostridium] dakarense]
METLKEKSYQGYNHYKRFGKSGASKSGSKSNASKSGSKSSASVSGSNSNASDSRPFSE